MWPPACGLHSDRTVSGRAGSVCAEHRRYIICAPQTSKDLYKTSRAAWHCMGEKAYDSALLGQVLVGQCQLQLYAPQIMYNCQFHEAFLPHKELMWMFDVVHVTGTIVVNM